MHTLDVGLGTPAGFHFDASNHEPFTPFAQCTVHAELFVGGTTVDRTVRSFALGPTVESVTLQAMTTARTESAATCDRFIDDYLD